MATPATLRQLLADGRDDAVALSAPSTPDLTFGALRAQIAEAGSVLRNAGINRADRVAIVLPNGPEMAVGFLAVASIAASAPLNPGYRADEFEFYLSDLGAKALIVDAGSASPAIEIARKLGVAIFTLTPHPEMGAGRFYAE